jgi:hypothetical protein
VHFVEGTYMTTNSNSVVDPIKRWRVLWGGLAAGLIVNAFEYGGHRVYLDDAWTAAFRALGKTPTGWSTFIPANFVIGILLVWLYARLRPGNGSGPKTALRSGLAVRVVFWVIPLSAFVPMDLFPTSLVAMAIALGVLDVGLAVLLGAWLYQERS